MKPDTRSLVLFALLTYFGLLPRVQAVSPPPPGGYPNFTTAAGDHALQALTLGVGNTALGWASLGFNVTGNFNTGVGAGTLLANTGTQNTAIGSVALFSNTTGDVNTATGFGALQNNTIGTENTANGFLALAHNTTGISNIALGYEAGLNVTTASNTICIGTFGNNVDDSCYIGNIFNATSSGGAAVFINSNGRLGTATSSRRFKEEIKPMDKTSEVLLALKPVTFRYKKGIDPQGIPQFGLVAEEVEKVNPDLVVRDQEGKPYSVRYDAVNAMLLNEFLKEHRTVQDLKSTVAKQEATIAQQQTSFQSKLAEQERQIAALTAGLQKVSAQLEASKPAPQVVNNAD